MTAPAPLTPVVPTSAVTTAAGALCDACPHPLAAHDPIGLRFCHATVAQAITRGCSCRTS